MVMASADGLDGIYRCWACLHNAGDHKGWACEKRSKVIPGVPVLDVIPLLSLVRERMGIVRHYNSAPYRFKGARGQTYWVQWERALPSLTLCGHLYWVRPVNFGWFPVENGPLEYIVTPQLQSTAFQDGGPN